MNSVFVLSLVSFVWTLVGGTAVLVFFLHRIYYSLPAVALVNLLERGIQRSVSSGRPIRGAKLKWYMT